MSYLCWYRHEKSLCKLPLNTPKALFAHIQLHHQDAQRYICGQEYCARIFNIWSSFVRHVETVHPPRSSSIQNSTVYISPSPSLLEEETVEATCHTKSVIDQELSPQLKIPNQGSIPHSIPIQSQMSELYNNFVTSLYNDKSLTRTNIQNVIGNASTLLQSVGVVLKDVNQCVSSNDDSIPEMIKCLENPFDEQKTEYKRLQGLENSKLFIRPLQPFLSQRLDERNVKGRTVNKSVEVNLAFIPLRNLFKTFFQIPGVFAAADSYLSTNQQYIIDDIGHSRFWKNKKEQFGDKFVVPLYLYYDEYECNNCIGAHSGIHKMGAMYVSLRCFPPEFHSRLDNIFLGLILHAQDLKEYGNGVFQVMVDELHHLEREGVPITLENGEVQRIYFALALILGDNEGLNNILGFSSCSSNFFCRICRGHKAQILNNIEEDESLLRTPDTHREDLATNDYQTTGVKEECIFQSLSTFDVTENFVVDIMHDGPAGGFDNLDLTLIIEYCLMKQLFDLEILNERIQNFDYGYIELGNKPPIITREMMDNKKITMKAAEMMCLVRNFGLIIGDYIPVDDSVWQLYICLCRIHDFIFAKTYQMDSEDVLEDLIRQHHTLYKKILNRLPRFAVRKYPFTPKLHNMSHYARIMKLMGPLRGFWCMRYEGKHQEGKKAGTKTNSRINLPFTIAMDHQIRQAYAFQCKTNLRIILEKGPKVSIKTSLLHNQIGEYMGHKWIRWNGYFYKAQECLVIIGIQDDEPIFAFLNEIVIRDDQIFFVVKETEFIAFDEHRNAYAVIIKRRDYTNSKILPLENIKDPSPLHARKQNDYFYITMPYNL